MSSENIFFITKLSKINYNLDSKSTTKRISFRAINIFLNTISRFPKWFYLAFVNKIPTL